MMFALTTTLMTGHSFRLKFVVGLKRLYVMMQKNAKTGIVLPCDTKIIVKVKTDTLSIVSAKQNPKRSTRGYMGQKITRHLLYVKPDQNLLKRVHYPLLTTETRN